MFLATRIDVGSSLETAEDLLMELGEFEIRAKVSVTHTHTLCHVVKLPLNGHVSP